MKQLHILFLSLKQISTITFIKTMYVKFVDQSLYKKEYP